MGAACCCTAAAAHTYRKQQHPCTRGLGYHTALTPKCMHPNARTHMRTDAHTLVIPAALALLVIVAPPPFCGLPEPHPHPLRPPSPPPQPSSSAGLSAAPLLV